MSCRVIEGASGRAPRLGGGGAGGAPRRKDIVLPVFWGLSLPDGTGPEGGGGGGALFFVGSSFFCADSHAWMKSALSASWSSPIPMALNSFRSAGSML